MKNTKHKLQLIFNHFISSVPASFRSHPRGLIHITYTVNSDRGSYILQRINSTVFRDPDAVMSNMVRITDHLAGKREYPYQVVKPLKLKGSNDYLYRDRNGFYWRLFPLLDETITHEITSDPHLVFKTAKAFGDFTSFLSDFKADDLKQTIHGFHDPVLRWKQFEDGTRDAIRDRARKAGFLIEQIKRQKSVFTEFNSLNLPIRIVHNDAKLSNILFNKASQEVAAIIDLDTAMPGTILCDFGDMVRTMVTNVSEDKREGQIRINKELFHAVWNGYCQGLGDQITPIEKEYLFLGAAYIILEQAVRFLVDYLKGDTYYRVDYRDQNLHRSGNQYELFQSLMSAEEPLCESLRG